VNISDGWLALTLYLGNAVTYAALGYVLVRFLERRKWGQNSGLPDFF
jgi:hypothetical protein